MKKFLTIVFLGFLLAACIGPPEQQTERQLQLMCRAYAATLTTLAAFNSTGALSESDVARVDEVRPVMNSACEKSAAGLVTDLDSALLLVQQGAFELLLIEQGLTQ